MAFDVGLGAINLGGLNQQTLDQSRSDEASFQCNHGETRPNAQPEQRRARCYRPFQRCISTGQFNQPDQSIGPVSLNKLLSR
jgi:hypothetical protein